MYYNKVEICGVNTSKLKTLGSEETRELLVRAREGDDRARQALVGGNLRLVLSIIQRFTNRREELDDLFQIGCIGLIKAIDNFNLELDVKFSTYAVPMIIGEVRRYLRDNNSIRVSRSVRDLAYRALSAKEILSREKGREPTIEEMTAYLKKQGIETTKERVVYALEAIVEPVSLYEPVFGDGAGDGTFLLDQISDARSGDESWLESIALGEAMKKLSERERSIINMRFFSGKTQMETAEEIGISQAQVSRLEKAALDKMKKQL
ncbi:MAG: RNA polymerase sporulation sigma factor SigG [Clostridia bacterium]|nr:RNA polymerase sporulation sigma factor SigG [Clostridia bacterium]